jgi:environmental stress-induced protein Ves
MRAGDVPIVIREREHRRIPWKNGKGVAREVFLLRAPERDVPDWGVSLAVISAPAPFSSFPNVDRAMCILSEEGIRLEIEGRPVVLDRESAPIHFAGEASVAAAPLGAEALNINFMAARGRVRQRVERMQQAEPFTVPQGRLGSFVFCTKGRVTLAGAGEPIALAAFDAAYLPRDGHSVRRLSPAAGAEWLLVILDEAL